MRRLLLPLLGFSIGCTCIGLIYCLAIYPANHPAYTPTQCKIDSNDKKLYRCCNVTKCECSKCAGLSCDALLNQSLNTTLCCKSDDCCAHYSWETCMRTECDPYHEHCHAVPYDCNAYCDTHYPTNACTGRCGECADFTLKLYTPEFRVSDVITQHCERDDRPCINRLLVYLPGAQVPCWYDKHHLKIAEPAADPYVFLYWILFVLAIVVALGSIVGCAWSM